MVAPVLMRRDEVICIKRAAHHARRSDRTIRRWIKQHGIGRQSAGGGPYDVSLPALEMVIHGDLDALEILRSGQRSVPMVRRYLEFLGLPE
ncbi:hypothetical protein [Aurantimonas coralicida]|uniref:hypothetical protein n=1 Tax=Aurantimonas coralicida TaxID=182270 RepID=UPI001E4E050C|nr:hypothetical protein [Aurantimonas coralicida]MCD1644803.1 hypothetical protein [Aurantimonas coralicida]